MVSPKILVHLWTVLSSIKFCGAIFAEDVGLSDFLVATAGHGPTKFVQYSSGQQTVVTSDSPEFGHQLQAMAPSATSCFVASRELEHGNLKWRRNVCTKEEDRLHTVAAAEENFWTMDGRGVVRGWTMERGELLWDTLLWPTREPRLLVPPSVTPIVVGAAIQEDLILLDANTGEQLRKPLQANKVLKDNGSSSRGDAHWIQMVSEGSNDKWQALVGWVHNRDDFLSSGGSDLMLVDLELRDDDDIIHIGAARKLQHVRGNLDVSTLQLSKAGTALALSADRNQAFFFDVSNGGSNFESADVASSLSLSKLKSISPMSENVARVSGLNANGEEKAALVQLPSFAPLQHQSQTITASGMALTTCENSPAFAFALQSDSNPTLSVWTADNGGGVLKESLPINMDMSTGATPANILESSTVNVLGCADYHLHALLSTASGTTSYLRLNMSKESSHATPLWKWTAEEGLGHITSALILDASHAVVVDDLVADASEEEPEEIGRRLSFSARLSSQWKSILGSTSMSSSSKDRLFGFFQIAVLVSELTHRLYGIELAGDNRGSVSWSIDLPRFATWHKLVHGSTNSPKSIHGIQGGTHAREVLVLSGNSNSVEWKCVDGTHGEIHAQGTVDISSPVLQIMPLVGGGSCRQQALFMHEDKTLSVIPDGPATEATLQHALEASSNGFYSHVISGADSVARLEAYQITSKSSPALLVGQTSFPGERLIQAVYPTRDEVVQSPCNVLGDDSLLLKYLNPHMAVLVTVRDDAVGEVDVFDAALKKAKKEETKQKKKPLGATPKGASKEASTETEAVIKEDEPNLFVNVVDTVSGRVLYRASHANVATSHRKIKAVISENWVVYSFVNAKTRKAEVGVLSLYEGMIHRKGLTAFTSPEQTTEFSSWDARESKPVVLAKTYSLPNPVTSLGVTQTRNGISSHQILLATNDDRVFAVERRMLEPRRPLSDLKDSEKLEGLHKYSELIPLLSFQALSYNQTVHAPTRILSSPTELESQTLVLTYGGPDVFFTRTSPSKGFDMLPESFNRILLSLLVVGLVSVVFVTKKMSAQKVLKHGWI